MAAAIGVRGDYDAARLRELAKRSGNAAQTRRLLALAAIYDGGSRTEAARIGGVGLQTVRDWVLAFNAEGPPGLVNGKAPGNAPLLTQAHRQALLEIVESGPIPAVHGVVRWRLIDLAQWVFDEFRISISKQTLSRELRALEWRKLSARPRHHAQDAEAMAAFKKTSLRASARSPSARRRASRERSGSRTRPGSVRRTRSPGAGRGAARGPRHRTISGPVRPTSSAPSARLEEPGPASSCRAATPPPWRCVWPGAAGCHLSEKLVFPANIALRPRPPKSPELNPVENIWQFIRDNWLSNRVFRSYDDILDHCCYAWNTLVDQPWAIL